MLVRLEKAAERRMMQRFRMLRTGLRRAVVDNNTSFDIRAETERLLFDDLLEIHAAVYKKGIIDAEKQFAKRVIRADLISTFLRGVGLEQFIPATQQQVTKIGNDLYARLTESVLGVMQTDLNARDRMRLLDTELNRVGITGANPHHIETLSRTSTNAFYQEAKYETFHDPDVSDIIWGYEYVTVGDDRVREEHEMMDGKVFEKDSPIWDIWWPPNGYNCRCDVLPLFADDPASMRRVSEPPEASWYPPSDFQVLPANVLNN